MIVGADDPTKDSVKAVILAVKELSGYQEFSPDQQKVLTNQLIALHDEGDTGIV